MLVCKFNDFEAHPQIFLLFLFIQLHLRGSAKEKADDDIACLFFFLCMVCCVGYSLLVSLSRG